MLATRIEHQVISRAVRQTVVLHGDSLIGGLFTARRTSPAVAGVAQVFDVEAALAAAGVLLHAQNRATAGQHFCSPIPLARAGYGVVSSGQDSVPHLSRHTDYRCPRAACSRATMRVSPAPSPTSCRLLLTSLFVLNDPSALCRCASICSSVAPGRWRAPPAACSRATMRVLPAPNPTACRALLTSF